MNLDDALQTFIIEAGELLEDMETALLRIEQFPDDADTINAIFRAAHTIKGSAGLFGFDPIVAFTHVAESVLDKVRNGLIPMTPDLVALLLSVADHLTHMIACIADKTQPDERAQQDGKVLEAQLRVYLDNPVAAGNPLAPSARPRSSREDESASEKHDAHGVQAGHWHLSLRLGPDVLRNGMDPLSLIHYLGTFGEIVEIITLVDQVPALSDLDPEANYLGFEIAFTTEADKATIDGAFEFVRDDASIHILPPHSLISDYQRLIDERPYPDMRLGDILVRCGTLTSDELAAVLDRQDTSQHVSARVPDEGLQNREPVLASVADTAPGKQHPTREAKTAESGVIRVNADHLDVHINLIGELIIASAGATLMAQQTGDLTMIEAVTRLAGLIEDLRDSALKLRMVQIGATFKRFQRVVHDVSAELGKDIRLVITGGDTDLDKTVVEKIGDPLTHLVRNSMDHGIEPAAVRLARGKPAHGTLQLNAHHDAGSIVIEVTDDGGGLDRARILAKAIDRGLVKPDQPLTDQAIHELIFLPGFSTVDKVSNLSGRGVGMDVVRRNITALRGTVNIDSTEGVGTTMRIRLPLTLAIIDGFLVEVNASSFVVPLDMVIECVDLSAQQSRDSQGRDHLNLRGEVLPFVRLKQLFDVPERVLADEDGTAHATGAACRTTDGLSTMQDRPVPRDGPAPTLLRYPVKRENVVVVQYGGRRAGLVVDTLKGEFQTVIRPLGEVFSGLDGISGFTLLGDGNVALILDVPGLMKRVADSERRGHARHAAIAGGR